MSADLYFTEILSFFLSFRHVSSEVAERNSTKIGHVVESEWYLKTHVRNLGYPFPYKSGPQNHLFRTTSQLNGNFNGLYLPNETGYKQPSKCARTTRGLLHVQCIKTTWTLVHKQLQIGSEFSPTLRKFCVPLHCQASKTEISKRNSTKLCQTVHGRSR